MSVGKLDLLVSLQSATWGDLAAECDRLGRVGERRLLNVAKALRESPNPDMFSMGNVLRHECGTPSCAWGHYVCRIDLQDVWKPLFREAKPWYKAHFDVGYQDVEIDYDADYDDDEVLEHFGVDVEEHDELFGADGCGAAMTAIQAAEYIENFVRRKLAT